jgi:hypothetical protein
MKMVTATALAIILVVASTPAVLTDSSSWSVGLLSFTGYSDAPQVLLFFHILHFVL